MPWFLMILTHSWTSHFFVLLSVDQFLFNYSNIISSFSSKAARCPRAALAEVEMEATQLLPTLGNNILSCLMTSKHAFFWRISSVFLILIVYHCNCKTFCSGKLHFRMGTVCSSRRRYIGVGADEFHKIPIFAQNLDRSHSSRKSTSFL